MRFLYCLMILAALLAGPVRAGDYDFEIPEAKKKPYEIEGRLEFRYIYHHYDEDSARYKLSYYQDSPGQDTHEWRTLLELSGGVQQGMVKAHMLTHHEYVDAYPENEWRNLIYEGYVSLTPNPQLTLDAGKKSVSWGKGYAWNPAGFINRTKDPDDATLNLEGRTLLGIDFIKSFPGGHLTNLGLTAMLLPVNDDWGNPDLSQNSDLVAALKFYMLLYDTDIDFIFSGGPDQPNSYGFDFAKNLAENIEVHGELALRKDRQRIFVDTQGAARSISEDQLSYLLGMRYLNTLETTFIAEYYHNGAGYSRSELDDFYAFQESAFQKWQSTGQAAVMQQANRVTRPYYQQRNYGRDYFYIKVSQKEPLDILYFNLWAAAVLNLQDFSFNLQPGFTWTALTDLELNFRVGVPFGPGGSEFGEKPDAVRPEIWIRYSF